MESEDILGGAVETTAIMEAWEMCRSVCETTSIPINYIAWIEIEIDLNISHLAETIWYGIEEELNEQ